MTDLRPALTELLDDYLAANGPDGYPQPMPQAWRAVADYLADGEPEVVTAAENRAARGMTEPEQPVVAVPLDPRSHVLSDGLTDWRASYFALAEIAKGEIAELRAALAGEQPVVAVPEAVEEWRPDWRVHPGESLREAIAALGISEAAFARRINVSPPFVSSLVRGRKGIGPRLALKLEAAGVGPAQFWLGMQMQFDLHRAREQAATLTKETR